MNVTPIGPQGVNAHTVLNDIMGQVPADSEIYCVAILKNKEGVVETRNYWHGMPLGLVIAAFEMQRMGLNLLNQSAIPVPTGPRPS